jgi:hypothetical protein
MINEVWSEAAEPFSAELGLGLQRHLVDHFSIRHY